MTWFFLWLSLILASIINFGYIGFVLWRKASATVRELGKTSEILQEFETKQTAYAQQLADPAPPALLNPVIARHQYQLNKLRKRSRHRDRQNRHARVHGQWDDIYS